MCVYMCVCVSSLPVSRSLKVKVQNILQSRNWEIYKRRQKVQQNSVGILSLDNIIVPRD
jgi:hypothetical protein